MTEQYILSEIVDLAKRIKGLLHHKIVLIDGPMGAGKTTFIKALCNELEVKDTVSSPTFSLINEYITSSGKLIYHFDCFRIENSQEALDFGAEEYLDSGNLCLIEWSDKISDLIPKEIHQIKINPLSNGKRQLTFNTL